MDPIDLKQAPGKSHSLCPRSGQGQQSEGSGQSSQTSNNTTRFKAKSEYKGEPMKETGSRSSTLNMLPSAPQQDGNGKRQEGGDEHRQSSTAQSVNSVPQSSSRVASEMEGHISQNGVPETFNGTCYFSQARTQSLSTRHAPDEGGSGAHHSPEEPAMVSSSSILRNFRLWIFGWGNGKTVTEEDKRRYTSKLERQNFELNQTLAKVKTEFSAFEKEAYETIAHHEQNNRELSSRFQQVEGEMMIHKTQIQKMSKIIASLNQRGLPLPPDDGYFHEEFKGIIAEIRQWARLFTREQPQLSPETLQQLEYKIPEKSRETLLRNFAHWQSPGIFDLYNALGTKFRTRCVEILLCGSAFEGLLLGPPVCLASQLYTLNDLSCCMGTASDEDKHLWRALSVHLLTQDNTMFAKVRTQKVHEITEAFLKKLEPFGVTDRASPEALYDIVERISELGLLIAKLPYIIHPLGANEALSPGCPFQADLMETLESSSESEMELQLEKVPTSLFLCQPWVKAPFTPDGRFGEHYSTVIMKAKVSCLV